MGLLTPPEGLTLISCRCILHVIDVNPNSMSANGWLEDTSKVEKYAISEAAYDEREHTFRKYKQEKLKVSVFYINLRHILPPPFPPSL